MIVNKIENNSKLTKYFEKKYKNSKYKDIDQFLLQYDENNNIPYEIRKRVRVNTLKLLQDEKNLEGFTSKKMKYNSCIKVDILIFLFIFIILIIRNNIY